MAIESSDTLEHPKTGDKIRLTPEKHEAPPLTTTQEERIKRARERLMKFRVNATPVSSAVILRSDERDLVTWVSEDTKGKLDRNYHPGFGISPTTGPDGNYSGQVWARDGGHVAGNYLALTNPRALTDFLETILRHQRPDGMLPLRVERTFALLRVLPGRLKKLSDIVFNLVEGKLRGRTERPVYENVDMSGGEDTVPAIVIATGEFFINSTEGVQFVAQHYDQLKRAMDFFRTKVDPSDGLAIIKNNNADWADSIFRKGKLGNINVMWARSLKMMEFMARQLGHTTEADSLLQEFHKARASVISKLYNQQEGYFRAKEGEDRIDTVASIGGALYLLDTEEAVRVEETLERRVRCVTGLRNFDPPYPLKEIAPLTRYLDKGRYHNYNVWPWVFSQNIQVKIKIAREHPNQEIRERYQRQAVEDLLMMSRQIRQIGAVEIADPVRLRPADSFFYHSQRNFMGTMAAYQGAYGQLKKLRWI